MLYEIKSSAFQDNGREREPIRFNQSLNVVLGSSNGSNSIGKSTFLLIVDFVFDGNHYVNCKDVLENVGPHTIDFAFVFDGEIYRFSRSPMDAKIVWKCDDDYQKIEPATLEEFNQWLLEKYGMEELGGSFRGLVSNFIRVYGKHNHNETKPLQSYQQDTAKDGIDRVIKLYGKYGTVSEINKKLKDANQAKKTYTDSLKRNFIISANNKTEYKRNQDKIAALQLELDALEQQSQEGTNDLDPIVAEQVATLKSSLASLRGKRTRLTSQIRAIDADADGIKFKKTKEFNSLVEFFPSADVKRLDEIETFHKKIILALESERKEQKEFLQTMVQELDQEVHSIETEIAHLGAASSLTKVVLRRYVDLSREIDQLKEANKSYEKKDILILSERELKTQRDLMVNSVLFEVQTEINEKLSVFNEYVCGKNVSVPRLSLYKPNSYDFSIPNDTGTGSQTRAMALFDLSLLEQTPLPIITLDTVSSKHISDGHMLRIMELYKKAGKQVIITFDKAESYDDGKTPRVIEGSVVLRLSEGHELFGKSWSIDEDS